MDASQLADLSRVLYFPTTVMLYLASAFTYLYALTTTVGRRDEQRRGHRARLIGGALAITGIGTHVAHEIVRGLAQNRLPLGNMFEVTSLMALVGVVVGLVYLQFIRKQPELHGFVMLGGSLVLGMAMLVYADPGPLMPILDTWWRTFHVSLLVGAMGIFTAAFIFMGLYLLRDTAELAVADARVRPGGGSTVGAAHVGDLEVDGATTPGSADGDDELERAQAAEYRAALRAGVPTVKLAVWTFVVTGSVSWVWWFADGWGTAGLGRFLTVNLTMVAAALLARWFVPYLPSTATLDGLAHRTVAFGFVMWTVGTIAGAMWAEVSWGRFWGWDPKETGAFLTWIAYAGYLHARATRGVQGRKAAWIGIGAFVVLMATYLIANYVIVGLHSYAEL
ncbi:MAG: cytochrome c biogenesis protein CcsA [Nitriliruptoraceae bacterium]|nr:cytochrome c biogenesis protein CcsA [Nitriliruptoraceae bacterium]